ncbi:hypothetical protein STAS_29589 [Striga asiatica]|uniref:Uncharacterized protein n=1 Tax=Striga asiatica TaxID=4170 RepID=A0A5A7R5Y3_STRAF|nr:hypothetical protein STAS_29589 [Striga asiatica]
MRETEKLRIKPGSTYNRSVNANSIKENKMLMGLMTTTKKKVEIRTSTKHSPPQNPILNQNLRIQRLISRHKMAGIHHHSMTKTLPSLHISRQIPIDPPNFPFCPQKLTDFIPMHLLHPSQSRKHAVPQITLPLIQQHLNPLSNQKLHHSPHALHHVLVQRARHSRTAQLELN